jgi:hypothetical protein
MKPVYNESQLSSEILKETNTIKHIFLIDYNNCE